MGEARTRSATAHAARRHAWVLPGAGAVIILVMVIAGIQYITSAGDPGNIKKAKGRLQAAIIALLLYMMMFAILNFLIPGGVL